MVGNLGGGTKGFCVLIAQCSSGLPGLICRDILSSFLGFWVTNSVQFSIVLKKVLNQRAVLISFSAVQYHKKRISDDGTKNDFRRRYVISNPGARGGRVSILRRSPFPPLSLNYLSSIKPLIYIHPLFCPYQRSGFGPGIHALSCGYC